VPVNSKDIAAYPPISIVDKHEHRYYVFESAVAQADIIRARYPQDDAVRWVRRALIGAENMLKELGVKIVPSSYI